MESRNQKIIARMNLVFGQECNGVSLKVGEEGAWTK